MSLKTFILNLLFPIECLNCKIEGFWLCEKCYRALKFTDKKYILKIPFLDGLFIAGDYDDKIIAELIKKLKFNFIDNLAPILGRFLSSFWSGIIFSRPDLSDYKKILLIPLPLSKKRKKWRGFNQAEIIARAFNADYDYEINNDLKKTKNKKPQSSLNEAERAKNIKNCFTFEGENIKDKTIILIDDVVTTGSTLNEAARILKEAGAIKIYGLVVAKG